MGKRVVDDASLTAVADAIRAKTGKTDSLVFPTDFEANMEEVFAAGKQAEYDRFWDSYQNNGRRYNYNASFGENSWTDAIYNPKYGFGQPKYISSMFSQSQISDTKHPLDLTALVSDAVGALFQSCTQLVTIRQVTIQTRHTFANAFNNCPKLENITFEGTIANEINFQWSPNLSWASIENIITHLSTTSSDKSVTFSKTAIDNAFETAAGMADGSDSEEWATLANTKPNWTINLV